MDNFMDNYIPQWTEAQAIARSYGLSVEHLKDDYLGVRRDFQRGSINRETMIFLVEKSPLLALVQEATGFMTFSDALFDL